MLSDGVNRDKLQLLPGKTQVHSATKASRKHRAKFLQRRTKVGEIRPPAQGHRVGEGESLGEPTGFFPRDLTDWDQAACVPPKLDAATDRFVQSLAAAHITACRMGAGRALGKEPREAPKNRLPMLKWTGFCLFPSRCLGATLFLLWVQVALMAVENGLLQWGGSGEQQGQLSLMLSLSSLPFPQPPHFCLQG